MTAPLRVLQPLGSDARSDLMLAELAGRGEVVLRVVKPTVPVDDAAFVARTNALAALAHPSLRRVLGAGRLADGRVYSVTTPVGADTLAARALLPIDQVVALGIEVARALEALHAAGLTLGEVAARDIILSSPPLLDASLAGLSMSGATPEHDVHLLADILLAAGAAGADRGPFESTVRKTLQGAATAKALGDALLELQARWRARTAVPPPSSHDGHTMAMPRGVAVDLSGEHGAVTDVEVMEPDLTGTQLGQWALERVLGEGAMGRVYLARHLRIGRLAAVKVLKQEHAVNAELVRRFIQEAQAVNAIRNEHIVEVYDFGEQPRPGANPRVFCVMELLEGESLANVLERGPLPVQQAVRICQQLARALHAAHQVGVVHRDIKPENIFLHRKGEDLQFVKVLDFGVAKLIKPLGDLPVSGTQAGTVIGTPEYMAPEQALGNSTDFRADLYAAGLVLYELLTGKQPFQGATFGKLVIEITQKPPPPLPARTSSGEALPQGLAKVVMTCLAKEPDHRFPSGDALASALEPFAYSGRTVVAEPEPAPAPVHEPAEALVAVRPSPLPKLLAAVAVLAAIAGVAFWKLAAEEPAPTPEPPLVRPSTPLKDEGRTPGPATVTLQVATDPPGATVTRVDSGEVLGKTPLTATLHPLDTLGVSLALDGFETQRREVNLSTSASLSVDLKPIPRAEPVKKKGPTKKVSRDSTVDPFSQ